MHSKKIPEFPGFFFFIPNRLDSKHVIISGSVKTQNQTDMKKLLFTFLSILCTYTVFAQCNPQFTWAAAPQGNNLLRVAFTNTTSFTPPNPVSYAYYYLSYGDNTSNSYLYSGGTAYHNYSSPGTYNAQLVMMAYDSLTQQIYCADSVTQLVTVGYSDCGSTISAVQTSAGNYTFTATTPAGTSGMIYNWSFGDGTSGTGSPVNHSYTNAGSYTVVLVATAPGGCSYTNTMTIQGGGTPNCANYVASFSVSANNMTGYFTNTSSFSNIAGVVRHADWDFGDGASMSGFSYGTSHVYNANGTYTVTLINKWMDSVTQAVYCIDTATQTITINGSTTPPPTNNEISGYVLFDSSNISGAVGIKVWLITYDSLSNVLTAIDSQSLSSWGFAYYSFSNEPAGTYYTKAAVTSGQTVGMPGIVPTYHDSSLYWANAAPIYHTGGTSSGNHIWMKSGIVTSGPGFIGGNISLGANKGTNTGVPNILVYLRDANNNLVRFTYTDANGDYSFGNIGTGVYTIYPEAMNYITIPSASITVTAGQPTVPDIDFKKTPTHIKPITTGIENVSGNVFQLYPNPSNGSVKVIWKAGSNGNAHIDIMNVSGSKVFTSEVNTGKAADLDLTSLQSGVYFIRISTGSEQHVEKLVLQR